MWEFNGTKRNADWMGKIKSFFAINFAQILVGTSMECNNLLNFNVVRKIAEVRVVDSDREKVGTKNPKKSSSLILLPVSIPIGNRFKSLPKSIGNCRCGPVGQSSNNFEWFS